MGLHLFVNHLSNPGVDQVLKLRLKRFRIILELFIISTLRRHELRWDLRNILDFVVGRIRVLLLLLQSKIGRLPSGFWRHFAWVHRGIIIVVFLVVRLNSLLCGDSHCLIPGRRSILRCSCRRLSRWRRVLRWWQIARVLTFLADVCWHIANIIRI